MESIPSACLILVIGGGPAGSYAASCLAREGHSVVLLEAEKFPRYHVGESMLPSMRHFLRFIDLEKQFEEHGFVKKMGAAFKFNPRKREGYSDFTTSNTGGPGYIWNVKRAEADELMLNHCKKQGVSVFDGVRVTNVEFSLRGGVHSPVAASWKDHSGNTGKISFEWLVDASGRNGVISKHLGTRKVNSSLKNIATWSYWRGAGSYHNTLASVGPPFFEALSDESGWAWFIPLHDGTTSVGIVMDEVIAKGKKSQIPKADKSILNQFYLQELEGAPTIKSLIGKGTLEEDDNGPKVRTASDYSYSATSYSGPNYRLVGDAAAFIDPFFSSGVHLALSSGLSAATTICAAIRKDCTIEQASAWHDARVGTSYTRFLVVVLSAYRQIRAQELPVLTDIDEDNFDRAFENIRIVIQGEADTKKNPLTECELRRAIDFCTTAWDTDISLGHGETPDVQNVSPGLSLKDKEAAHEALRTDDFFGIELFASDKIDGMNIRMQRGQLGLAH